MATRIYSFLLSDGDGTSCIVMKLAMSNKSKWEIATMGCFKKCGNKGCEPCNISSNGFTPCIARMESRASLRSRYGKLFF
jgi:hypothetical protein